MGIAIKSVSVLKITGCKIIYRISNFGFKKKTYFQIQSKPIVMKGTADLPQTVNAINSDTNAYDRIKKRQHKSSMENGPRELFIEMGDPNIFQTEAEFFTDPGCGVGVSVVAGSWEAVELGAVLG
ncbi:hypothetical protein CFOL_v3_35111 [Cephalotus follicularis]|uniref:Uncharacterized protein n=1 Tax=Cephalotus follicularis TaxID=3775 RepID=A0A1Q3DGX6_CEPFO|nr:hypothetical protein CFOL_v3_35111 [Cephalotus follicularis]